MGRVPDETRADDIGVPAGHAELRSLTIGKCSSEQCIRGSGPPGAAQVRRAIALHTLVSVPILPCFAEKRGFEARPTPQDCTMRWHCSPLHVVSAARVLHRVGARAPRAPRAFKMPGRRNLAVDTMLVSALFAGGGRGLGCWSTNQPLPDVKTVLVKTLSRAIRQTQPGVSRRHAESTTP